MDMTKSEAFDELMKCFALSFSCEDVGWAFREGYHVGEFNAHLERFIRSELYDLRYAKLMRIYNDMWT